MGMNTNHLQNRFDQMLDELVITHHFFQRYNKRVLGRNVQWTWKKFKNHLVKKLTQSEKRMWSRFYDTNDIVQLPLSNSKVCIVSNKTLITIYDLDNSDWKNNQIKREYQ